MNKYKWIENPYNYGNGEIVMNRVKSLIKCILFCAGIMVMVVVCDYAFGQSGYVRYILCNLNDEGQNYDTIVLGASHARSAIDPQKIDNELGTNSLNMAIPGETIKDSYYVLEESCRNNDVKKVIFDIDYQYWVGEIAEGYFTEPFVYAQLEWSSPVKWKYMLDNMDVLDVRNAFSKRLTYECSLSSVKNNIALKSSEGYKNADINTIEVPDANGPYVGKGFFNRLTSGACPGGMEYVQQWSTASMQPIAPSVMEQFDRIYNYCKENGIELICVTSPITPSAMKILNMDCADETLSAFFEKYEVKYYNFNKARMDVLPRQDVDYGDMEGHMGGALGEEYSEVLADVLKDHDNGNVNLSKYFYASFDEMYDNMEADFAKTQVEN